MKYESSIGSRSRISPMLGKSGNRDVYKRQNLYYAGVDLRTAQYLLGHSSIQMTAQVYTHLDHKDGLSAAEKINAQFVSIV